MFGIRNYKNCVLACRGFLLRVEDESSTKGCLVLGVVAQPAELGIAMMRLILVTMPMATLMKMMMGARRC